MLNATNSTVAVPVICEYPSTELTPVSLEGRERLVEVLRGGSTHSMVRDERGIVHTVSSRMVECDGNPVLPNGPSTDVALHRYMWDF